MFNFIAQGETKPNRFDFPKKNKEYHLKYGRFTLSDASGSNHRDFLAKYKINKDFYRGNQWVNKEDVEAFLKDDTNQDRNRIKIVHNLIRPLIEQFRGNAILLKINASAKSISKKAVNRRENSLSEKLLLTDIALEFPALGRLIKDSDKSVGDSQEETSEIHENLYIDSYVPVIDMLLQYVKDLNDLDSKQVRSASHLGLSGLSVIESFEHGGHQRYEVVEPDEFFFDNSARKGDLTDADYMGKMSGMLPTDLYETYQNITQLQREAIESFVAGKESNSNNGAFSGVSSSDGIGNINIGSTKIPVVHSYWRDHERKEAGYVLDEYGYPYLIYIGETVNNETGEPYTEDDLIDPPESPKNDRIFKGRKKRPMSIDVLRHCIFVPAEFIGQKGDKEDRVGDIVLDWGITDYQETEWLDLSNVKFPFKCATWGYIDGEIMSPVDDAINPQRFVNRVLSVAESQINNSGGMNIVIDKDSIDHQDGEAGLQRDIDNGKAISIRTKGRGVPNSIGTYDATPKQGTYNLFNIIPLMEGIIQKDTGVNEALRGESTGSDQLVGVTEKLIQRGSLMQEPFYSAISSLYLQVFQHTATVGKRMYIDNERELAIATGDNGVQILNLSKGMRNEDFRVFIERENDQESLKAQGDQLLNVFLQSGLIDEIVYSNLFSRSTPSQVAMALREQASKKIELRRQQAKQSQKDQQIQQQELARQDAVQQQALNDERNSRSIERLEDQNNKLEQIALKSELDSLNKQNNASI